MDFSQVLVAPSFTLSEQNKVAGASASDAMSSRKRSHESASNSVVQPIQHDDCLLSASAVPESLNRLPIKQRIISTSSDFVTTNSSPVSRSSAASAFALSAEQVQAATSDARLIMTIAKFPPVMQGRLQTFRHNENIKAILINASVFLETLSARDIELSLRRKEPRAPLLFITKCNPETEHWLLSSFFRKATVFFSAVDREKIWTTSCLSNMLQHKKHIQAFVNMRDEDIQRVAMSPNLKRLGTLHRGKGLPDVNNLRLPKAGFKVGRLNANPDTETVLGKFCLAHQRHLRDHRSDERANALLDDGATLIGLLEQRGIQLTLNHRRGNPSARLFDALAPLDAVKDHQIISSFFRKAMVFFNAVDSTRIDSTECLCAMLQHRLHIEMFTVMDDADIVRVAHHPLLLQLAWHQHGKGLPSAEGIQHITSPSDIKRLNETHSPSANAIFEAVIRQFVPAHQAALRQYLYVENIQTLLNNAAKVMDTVAKRGIRLSLNRLNPPASTLFSTLKSCNVLDDYQLMSDYFRKIEVFFSAVDTAEIRSTCCLSNIIRYKVHIRALTDMSDDKVREFARTPCLKQLCTVYRYKDLTDLDRINDFVGLEKLRSERGALSCIATMCYNQGMPSADKARDFIQLFQGQNRALISTIAAMCKDRGLPDADLVTDFLTLQQVQKKERVFSTLAVVCHALGIPSASRVRDFLQWLPAGQTTIYLNLLSRFFRGAGIPELFVLNKHEQALEKIFQQHLPPQPGFEDNLLSEDRFKPFALFCINPNEWRLNVAEFRDFLQASYFSSRHSALATMQAIVLNLGGAGVRLWLAKFNDNTSDMNVVTEALLVPASLDIISFALSQLTVPHWLNYIGLCKNLVPAPDRQQWESLLAFMEKMDARFAPSMNQKRMLLEILWSQSNRQVYETHIDCLFLTVPTVRQLYHVYRQVNRQKMKVFLDACVAWQRTKSNPPELPVIEALMDGLLLAHYPIDCPGHTPDHCFSQISMNNLKMGIMIDGAAVMTGNERLWYFVVAMLMELNRVGYRHVNISTLSFISPPNDTVYLPKPRFTLTKTGFVINNWAIVHQQAFFLATDFVRHNTRPNICKKLASEHIKKAAEKEKQEITFWKPATDKSAAVRAEQDSGPEALADMVPEDCSDLTEPADLGWLPEVSDFPEDWSQLEPDNMSVEQILAFMESDPDSSL